MVEAQLEAVGCLGDRYADRMPLLNQESAERPDGEGDLFDRLGRTGVEFSVRGGVEDNVITIPSRDDEFSLKAYRTMCVRTCDGYYFPMSPVSSRDDFGRDQQNCESICPDTEMRIYYQSSGLSDVASMMSAASEEPYPDLPAAYLYRRADVPPAPACGCGQLATA